MSKVKSKITNSSSSSETESININEEEITCPECGNTNFAITKANKVCKVCGVVIEPIYQNDHWQGRFENAERYGSPESRRHTSSTFFRVNDVKTSKRRSNYNRYRLVNGSLEYDAIEENLSRLLNILTTLGLSSNERNNLMFELKTIYTDAKRNEDKITNIFLIAAALTIKLLKRKGRAISISDVVSIYKQYGCKISNKAIRDHILDNNIRYLRSSKDQYISKYMAKLRSDDDIRSQILDFTKETIDKKESNIDEDLEVNKVLTTIERMAIKLSKLNTGAKKPSVISAAGIFIASKLIATKYGKDLLLPKSTLSSLLDVPQSTLRTHVNYLSEKIKVKL